MTLNHSKTWPVSTVAVVQLRVDPHGRTYSELADMLPPPAETPPPVEAAFPVAKEEVTANDGEVWPLSRRHLEIFTRMAEAVETDRPPRKPKPPTIRTDTISTILDPIEFEEEGIMDVGDLKFVDDDIITSPSSAINGITDKSSQNGNVANATTPTSVASAVLTDGTGYRFGRRPSCRVDNWDYIYKEAPPNSVAANCPVHRFAPWPAHSPPLGRHQSPYGPSDSLLPLDLPLDARKAATLRRHYYPEGGWGFVVAVCGVLVHLLNHGLQLGCSQMVSPGVEKFKVDRVHFAGYKPGKV